jgi:hypothetical protein
MNEKRVVTKLCFLCVLHLLASPCNSQNATSKAETTGACSPAISGNNNQVNISCQGISKDQAAKMTSILNKILANQIDPDAVMAKLDEILKAVNPNKAVATYDFNGFKRVISPGRIEGSDGEMAAFKELVKANTSTNWKEMLSLSEAEKSKAQEWLTPYFFAGLAYANLCEKDKAISNLKYFIEWASGSKSYETAIPDAERILGQLRDGGLPPTCH